MRKTTLILYIIIAIGLAGCKIDNNRKLENACSENYKAILSRFLNTSVEEIDSAYVFYDSMHIISLKAYAYKFYSASCDTGSWSNGYIIIDSTTGNSYIVNDRIIPKHCIDSNSRRVYKERIKKEWDNRKSDIAVKLKLGTSVEIYNNNAEIQRDKLPDYLNNIAWSYRGHITRSTLDSLFRFFYFDHYNFSKPLKLIQSIEEVLNSMNACESSWNQYVALDKDYKNLNKQLRDNFRSYITKNINNNNFFVYNLDCFIILIKINIDKKAWNNEGKYTIDTYNTFLLIDSTYNIF